MGIKPKRVTFTPVTQAADNIALTQTPGGAGNLVLNGALASAGAIPAQTLAYKIGLTSAGNDSGQNFTITGTDADGNAQTETLAGPNANTVVSTKYFKSISSIAINGAAGAALTVGTVNTVDSAVTRTYCLDSYSKDTSIAADISGTINFDVQKAFERPTAGEVANWVAGGLTGQTADANTAYTSPTGAVRVRINSYTNGATLALGILQARAVGGI